MQFVETSIPGCLEIIPNIFRDERGYFVKTYHQDIFNERGLVNSFAEEYYSFSHKGVVRGLHFQLPPEDHYKLVYCVSGAAVDAVVDLRQGSLAYGRHALFDLSAEKGNLIYIPPGLAHGFFTVSDNTILIYKVTTVYSPRYDSGILWNSVGIDWPGEKPIISKRDSLFPHFSDFISPFHYK